MMTIYGRARNGCERFFLVLFSHLYLHPDFMPK